MKNKKETMRAKRHRRIKLTMHGSAERPRLVIRRSLKNLAAQAVNDSTNKVLFSLSTFDKGLKDKFGRAGNIKSSALFGEIFAEKAKEKGIKKIIFDRAGYLYQGRIKAFADALRKGGLEF